MNEIMFLPSNNVDMFLAMKTPMDKLRYAVKSLAESHNVEYNLDELEYNPDMAEFAEPYASLRGHNVPLLMDCKMLVEYLNSIEPNAFYMEHSALWENICICYIPEEQRM